MKELKHRQERIFKNVYQNFILQMCKHYRKIKHTINECKTSFKKRIMMIIQNKNFSHDKKWIINFEVNIHLINDKKWFQNFKHFELKIKTVNDVDII